jgi:hypothetical protein
VPSGAVKAVVLVTDLDEVIGFLELAGVAPIARFHSTGEMAAVGLGWPDDRASSSSSRSPRRCVTTSPPASPR